MPFIDIAYQAEISRYEDTEFEEIAKRNCHEYSDTRNSAIEELRTLIQEKGEFKPRRTDDAYCLRFLRARLFIPLNAYKLMVHYEEFRKSYSYLYNCDPFGLNKVKFVYGGVIPESPDTGRTILMRFGRWDPASVPIEDVVRCALLMVEIGMMQPKLQILGLSVIVDLEGLSLRHVKHLTSTVAYQIVHLMGISFPVMIHATHVINYSWILNSFFYLFKQFIPPAVWNRLHFHGSDLTSLQKFIQADYLPKEYGGKCQYVGETEEWVTKIYKYKDDFLVQELRNLGYMVFKK